MLEEQDSGLRSQIQMQLNMTFLLKRLRASCTEPQSSFKSFLGMEHLEFFLLEEEGKYH